MEEGGAREGKQRKRKLRKHRRGGGKQKKQNTFKNGKWEVNAGEMR